MKNSTLSIVVGTRACNAHCRFCVSRMTGFDELPRLVEIDAVNFNKACRAAVIGGTMNVLLTGKGEPLLYPEQVTQVLYLLEPHQFPFIALQTNGLDIGWLAANGKPKHAKQLSRELLEAWRQKGLDTIAISAVSHHTHHNREVYADDYPHLETTVRFLHEIGFTVRLCVMMQRGMVDTPERVEDLIDFCRHYTIEQLTVRPIRRPTTQTHDSEASRYVAERGLDPKQERAIAEYIRSRGTLLYTLSFGAEVYDINGQNCCLSDCLTLDGSREEIRTLIVYANGRVTHDWQYDGAVFLRGVDNTPERSEQ